MTTEQQIQTAEALTPMLYNEKLYGPLLAVFIASNDDRLSILNIMEKIVQNNKICRKADKTNNN